MTVWGMEVGELGIAGKKTLRAGQKTTAEALGQNHILGGGLVDSGSEGWASVASHTKRVQGSAGEKGTLCPKKNYEQQSKDGDEEIAEGDA